MPLSALRTIDINAPYWQGWRDYLTQLPSSLTSCHPLISQEGLSTQGYSKPTHSMGIQSTSAITDTQMAAVQDKEASMAVHTEGKVAYFLNQIAPTYLTQVLGKSFVPQSSLPVHLAYETFIFEQHKIPTRDGLHDFFNGLCWFLFPRTKQIFNQLHQQQIQQLGSTQRGRIRDRLTIIDENGFLISCPDALWEALCQKNWIKAFWTLRPLWKESKVMVFGHALLEKLVFPYKTITAHAIRIPSELCLPDNINRNTDHPDVFSSTEIQHIDHYLSTTLTAELLTTKPYIPLPIFGIPEWSEEAQDAAFYADTQVFRQPHPLKS